jgi:hypothetical protein
MNAALDDVWTYSVSNRNAYIRSGVRPDRVHAIQLGACSVPSLGGCRPRGHTGVDPAVFAPEPLPGETPVSFGGGGKAFRFLYVGGTIGRKGFDVLLRAYEAEFTAADDVTLVVKDMGAESIYAHMNGAHLITQVRGQ